MGPKPGAHQACMDGHAAGAKAAHKFALQKHTEYLALKAATNATDGQIEEVMEKEAEIEEELTQAAREDVKITKDEEAEAIKKMKDELLRRPRRRQQSWRLHERLPVLHMTRWRLRTRQRPRRILLSTPTQQRLIFKADNNRWVYE